MMCSVLGVRDPRAWRHAIDLGIAVQLTNICRDVLEDAQASRVYLPADRLRAYGVAPKDLVEGRADGQAVSLVVTGHHPGWLAGLPYTGAGTDAEVRVDVDPRGGRLDDGRHNERGPTRTLALLRSAL
jgi:hypothetical protein